MVKNAKFNMLRVYRAYERECEENKKKQEIEDKYDWPGCSYVVYIVNDDIAIVEELYRGDTKGYYSHVNGKKEYFQLMFISVRLVKKELLITYVVL